MYFQHDSNASPIVIQPDEFNCLHSKITFFALKLITHVNLEPKNGCKFVYANLCQSMPIYANLCQSMPIYANLCQYGYGSKKGYELLCGDLNVWNDGVTQMISNDFYLFKRVWIACGSGVWIGQPSILRIYTAKKNGHFGISTAVLNCERPAPC